MTHESLLNELWQATLKQLGGAAAIEASAHKARAFLRPRAVKSATDLLRLILAYWRDAARGCPKGRKGRPVRSEPHPGTPLLAVVGLAEQCAAQPIWHPISATPILIASSGGVSQVVNGIPQSWIAGEPSGDGAAFARSPGDGGHAAQFA